MIHSKFFQLLIAASILASVSSLPCLSTQYQSDSGVCNDCPATCVTCSALQFCTACVNNYYLVSDLFTVTCQPCSGLFPGCQTCASNLVCSVCSVGYYLSNNVCKACNTNILYCSQCSADGATCSQCYFPYILQNNFCVNGQNANTNGSSSGNSSSNSSSGNSTTPTTKTITLPNGTIFTPVIDAFGCNQYQFYWNNLKCLYVLPHCQTYIPDGSGRCQVCAVGYQITIYNDCAPTNRTLNCQDGFWLNGQVCTPVDASCDYYYFNNGTCFNCSTGYIFNSDKSVCVPSITCGYRQFFYAGSCVKVPDTCVTFLADGTCTTCTQGYNLNSGICTKSITVITATNCVFPCKTCHPTFTNFCYSCQLFYQLQGGAYGNCVPNVSV